MTMGVRQESYYVTITQSNVLTWISQSDSFNSIDCCLDLASAILSTSEYLEGLTCLNYLLRDQFPLFE